MVTQNKYGQPPTIFISSTCYDLNQIRLDIQDFFNKELGYEALLSELKSFPIDPDMTALDNCINIVKKRADIFCLIIGGRYGSVAESGKSVTNLEYINAKMKGIPIYVFVKSDILPIMKVWEKNPDSDFSDQVDDIKVFEFIRELRSEENLWTFDFNNAQDIIKTLRTQLGYLFYDSLIWRNKLNIKNYSTKVLTLNGKCLKYIIEKPLGWEYLLFCELLKKSIDENKDIKKDLQYGYSTNSIIVLDDIKDILDFNIKKFDDLTVIIKNLEITFHSILNNVMGSDDKPCDLDGLLYACEKMSNIYKRLMLWRLDFSSISVNDDYKKLIDVTAKLCDPTIKDYENYVIKVETEVKKLINSDKSSPDKINLDLTYHLSKFDPSEYEIEIKNIVARYELKTLPTNP